MSIQPYPLQGEYPAVPGNKPWSIADITGPASYTEVTPGATPSGGQVIQASAFGLQRIDAVLGCSGSTTATYDVVAYLVDYGQGKPCTSIRLMWRTSDGGVEVVGTTALDGEQVRIMVVGS